VADARGLDELRADLQLALQAGRMGVWSWDLASGRVTWDETMAELFGIDLASFSGTYDDWMSRIHPDDRRSTAATVDAAVEHGDRYTLVRRVIWPDGSVHWIEGRADVMTDDHGEVIGARGVSMDVTQREMAIQREAALRGDLALLAEAGVVLASTLDGDALVRGLAELVVPRIADGIEVVLLEPGGVLRRSVHAAGVDQDRLRRRELQPLDVDADHPIAEVVRTGQSLVLGSGGDRGDWALGPADAETSARGLGLGRAVIVPVRTRSSTIGAMALGYRFERIELAHELQVADELAQRFALAYDNAQLYREQRTIADTLQRGLLPAWMPTVADLDVAARYWVSGSGTEVGGDFYDVIASSDDPASVTIMIGDVCGKGAQAASLTALARHTLRAAALEEVDPAESLRWLHRALEAERGASFVTAVVAQLHTRDGRASGDIAIGGHPRPIIRRADGSVEQLEAAGPPPGMPLWHLPPLLPVELDEGDTLVLYTDGVTDVPGDAGISVGELCDLISRTDAKTPDDLADVIGGEIERRRPRQERSDDIALLALRSTRTTTSIDFTPSRTSPALVRRWLTARLGDDHPMLHEALLCTSELVSNAVLHAGTDGVVRLRRAGGRLRVEVFDGDLERQPAPRDFNRHSVTGRGLRLVIDLSLDWGTELLPDGKMVWFELGDEVAGA
jgi:serine phosphatase RsbU (regulator of sigma subunit)